MLVDRNKIDAVIEKKLSKYCVMKDMVNTMCDIMMKNHDIPAKDAMDIIVMRRPISEVDTFMLYCISEALAGVDNRVYPDKWFTEKEIKDYQDAKISIDKIKFPIILDAFKVCEGHYIAASDVRFFMRLRRSQMIQYNTSTQRTMKRTLRGGEESYKISLNTGAVSDIRYEMEHDEYIPNTITLRIPEENSEYYFKDNRLVIQKLDAFEIADGFHRYIAMCQASDANPDFNIPMELRIIAYSEQKTRQFIWQEDQKTKMVKVDSDSMNTNAGSNIICEALNEDMTFNLKGAITRNGGQIPLADFSMLINKFYFRNVKREEQKVVIIREKKRLRDFFNYLTEEDERFLTRKYDLLDLLIILCIIESGDVTNAGDIIDKARETILNDVNLASKIRRRSITDSLIKKVGLIVEEVR